MSSVGILVVYVRESFIMFDNSKLDEPTVRNIWYISDISVSKILYLISYIGDVSWYLLNIRRFREW